jgi:flagellin-like protein
MTRHIRATKKGISPVIATVILVAVAITVSVSVAYWMGGISSLYTRLEKVEVVSVVVNKGTSSYKIDVYTKNTGSADATVDGIFLNGKLLTQYTTPTLNSTLGSAGTLVAAGDSATITVGIGSQIIPPFTAGTTIELKLHTSAGKDYPQMVTLS